MPKLCILSFGLLFSNNKCISFIETVCIFISTAYRMQNIGIYILSHGLNRLLCRGAKLDLCPITYNIELS